jgi:D-alanyl-lipoteichoic acid acyltransferase DltB (MBOAT superfamily)
VTAVSVQLVAAIVLVVAAFWSAPSRYRWLTLSLTTVAVLAYTAPLSATLLAAVGATSYLVIRAEPSLLWRYAYATMVFCVFLVLRAYCGGGFVWFGAAFYVLRALHVVLEGARGGEGTVAIADYVYFLLFPPTFAVGPVERFGRFQREIRRNRWNSAFFSAGLETILYGYAQIVLLGDVLIGKYFHSYVLSTPAGTWRSWLSCIDYGASLYFKFAGYSDIAIGVALLLGMRVMENFDRPYLARNIADFWRRWHISVTSWCRDYVNMPVLALTRHRGASAVSAMVVLGLWHELSPRYLLWGLFHGVGIAIWNGWRSLRARWPEARGIAARIEAGSAWALTMVFVTASFAITKEATLAASWGELVSLFGGQG